MTEFFNWLKGNKLLGSGVIAAPFVIVLSIFAPNPKDIVYADLDKRYAMNEQVQRQLQTSEKNILLVFKQNRLDEMKREIYFLEKLRADNRATPDDIARLNELIRERDDLVREINKMRSQ